MDVSIVLSTWNNAQRLRSTIKSILEERPVDINWELVVVNNACEDDTDDVVATFNDVPELVYVHEPAPGLSHGRNAGLRAASGSLIVFTDDDVEVPPGWIETYWGAFTSWGTLYHFGGGVRVHSLSL